MSWLSQSGFTHESDYDLMNLQDGNPELNYVCIGSSNASFFPVESQWAMLGDCIGKDENIRTLIIGEASLVLVPRSSLLCFWKEVCKNKSITELHLHCTDDYRKIKKSLWYQVTASEAVGDLLKKNSIRTLLLSGNANHQVYDPPRLKVGAAKEMARILESFSSLERLELRSYRLSCSDISTIMQAFIPRHSCLEAICLYRVRLEGVEAWQCLGHNVSKNASLKKIEIHDTISTSEDAVFLSEAICKYHQLETLVLSNNSLALSEGGQNRGIDYFGHRAISLSVKTSLPNLQTLVLDDMSLSRVTLRLYSKALKEKLSLKHLQISNHDNLRTLHEMDMIPFIPHKLCCNDWGYLFDTCFGDNYRLLSLDLEHSGIEDGTIILLAGKLQTNKTLKVLNLSGNGIITKKGWKALLRLLWNPASTGELYRSNHVLQTICGTTESSNADDYFYELVEDHSGRKLVSQLRWVLMRNRETIPRMAAYIKMVYSFFRGYFDISSLLHVSANIGEHQNINLVPDIVSWVGRGGLASVRKNRRVAYVSRLSFSVMYTLLRSNASVLLQFNGIKANTEHKKRRRK
jgi:hypothetical protein